MKLNKLTYKDFKKYFSNHLLKKEKHDFEKKMMQDEFESEAFDGLSTLSGDELESDITELRNQIKNRTTQTKRIVPVWFRYAASVIVLIGLGMIFYLVDFSDRNIYKSNQITQEPEIEEPEELEKETVEVAKVEEEQLTEKDEIIEVAESEELMSKEDKALDEIMMAKKKAEEIPTILEQKQEEVIKPEVIISDDEEFMASKAVDSDYENEIAKSVSGIQIVEEEELSLQIVENEVEAISEAYESVEFYDEAERKEFAGVAKADAILLDTIKDYRIISGIVKDVGGEPIPFANVIIVGADIGVLTDMDGNFSIKVGEDELVEGIAISYIGYDSRIFDVTSDTNNIFELEPSIQALEEVVVLKGKKRRSKASAASQSSKANPGTYGGMKAYKKEIQDNLNYENLQEFPGKHRILFSFNVAEDGSIYNYKFVQFPDSVFIEEIIRVMEDGPNWEPARIDFEAVESEVQFELRISVD